jgi:5-methylcytosine-specific restriction endonuclease McrA
MERYSEQIISLRNEGKSYKEIKKILGCALSTISYHCTKNKVGGFSDRLSDDDKKKLQELYDELGSVKKVRKMTGRSVETILKYVATKKPIKKITSSESVINWRKRTKQKLIQYKGGSCELCGYSKCERALEFHHINPEEKDFSISGKSLSFDKLKDEVDKCMLVCSNCHSEIHDGLINL